MSRTEESGSTLLVAMITMVVLTTLAASVFFSSVPSYRGTYQMSAWHEAKMAADAGVDFAVDTLQKTLPSPMLYTWPGWKKADGTDVTADYNGIRIYTPPPGTLGKGDGSSKPRILKIEVDVITRDDNFMHNAWFRIRSTGLAEVNSSQMGLDKRDLSLRRMALRNQHITRTLEVLCRPVYLWEYALKTSSSMTLGGGSTWRIDSYDSRYREGDPNRLTPDPRSDPNGIYALQYSRAFGNIASNLARPLNSPIGMLIDAEGAMVRGEVQTNGGDNPDTIAHENVEQADQIDPVRITDEYREDLSAAKPPWWNDNNDPKTPPDLPPDTPDGKPLVGTQTKIATGKTGSTAGETPGNPFKIIVNAQGNQRIGGFEVVNFTPGQDRFVDIVVNGDVDLNGSTIQVQKGVHVNLYLNGDLNFRNQDINYIPEKDAAKRPLYSMRPGDLLIYGLKPANATPAPKVESSGNGHIVAAFYGPQYGGNLDGNTEIMGSFVLKTYSISGGGGSGGDSLGAGFHYDEALGVMGPVKYYKSVSYFEDTRKDIE